MKKAVFMAVGMLLFLGARADAQIPQNYTYGNTVMPGAGFGGGTYIRPGGAYAPGYVPPYAPQYGYAPPGYGYNQLGQYVPYGGISPYIYQPYVNMRWGLPQAIGSTSYFSVRAGGTNFNFWHA